MVYPYVGQSQMDWKKETFKIVMNQSGKSRGLGDTFAKVTKASGVKKIVDTVSKAIDLPCGCPERQDTLNRLFPYNNK